jgi:protein-tyrosine phosphatase
MTRRILFVCLGNICRSPTAEGIARARAAARGLDLVVDSAGTGGWHVGDPPDPRMQAAARRAGYDLSDQRARQVGLRDFAGFDLIVAMDRSNRAVLERLRPPGAQTPVELLLSHGPEGRLDVPDPYLEGGFDAVVALIEAAVERLLDRIAAGEEPPAA